MKKTKIVYGEIAPKWLIGHLNEFNAMHRTPINGWWVYKDKWGHIKLSEDEPFEKELKLEDYI